MINLPVPGQLLLGSGSSYNEHKNILQWRFKKSEIFNALKLFFHAETRK